MKLVNDTCESVILIDFIECLNNKNYSILKKFKYAPVSELKLKESWEKLFEQYCVLSGNSGYSEMFDCLKKLYKLDSKYISIISCIKVLSHGYDKESVDILNSFGYKYTMKDDDPEKMRYALERIISKSKTILVEIESEKKKLEGKKQKEEQNQSDYFNQSLVYLSKYMGFRIDPKQITVAEFCSMTSEYSKEIERLTKMTENGKGNR